MKHFINRVQRQVLAGLILIVPFAITIVVAVFIYHLIDRFVGPLVMHIVPPTPEGEFGVAALAVRVVLTIVVTLLILFLAGFLSTTYVTHEIYQAGEQLVLRTPFVKTIYGTSKQLIHLVTSNKNNLFKQMALVEFPRPGSWTVAFVTGHTHLSGDPRQFVSVLVPHAPNPLSGFVLILPADQVRVLDVGVEDGIKMIMSGGVIIPDQLTARPLTNPTGN
jgi:uncharacterized membrane protein